MEKTFLPTPKQRMLEAAKKLEDFYAPREMVTQGDGGAHFEFFSAQVDELQRQIDFDAVRAAVKPVTP